MYDGFYPVCTTLEDDVTTILRINKRRWEIEESFGITKPEFKARPVNLQNNAPIRAYFMTCFLSLMVFRLLKKHLDENYTETEITDALHDAFGLPTNRQIITEKKMKEILKATKK